MADYGELGYLMGQRQRAANPGAQSLGFLLGGGGAARQAQIFNQAAYRGAQMQDVMAQARQRQQSAIARQNLAEQMRQSGDPEQMLLGQMVLASGPNINPSEFAKARETALKMKIQQELVDRAKSPDFNQDMQTRLLEAFEGKPMKHAEVQGDTYFDPYMTPGSQTPTTTAVGKARIAELGSLVNEHAAQAERARAGISADKASNYEVVDTEQGKVRVNKLTGYASPVMLNGKEIAKPVNKGVPKSFTEPEMTALFGGSVDPNTGKAIVDPAKLKPYLDFKAQNPGLSDVDVYSKFRNTFEDNANPDIGPPAPEQPGLLSRIFGLGSPTDATQAQASATPQAQAGGPQIGEVRKGYRFKGGDPSDKANWEKV